MPGRTSKLSPSDVKKIAASARSGVPVTVLAKTYGVTRPTIYRALHALQEKEAVADAGTAPVSFTVDRNSLAAFDTVTGRLGLSSRADALRRLCRVPAGVLEPDPDLASALRAVAGELSAIGRNVNQLVATKNYEIRRGQKLKLTPPQQQLLVDLLEQLEGVSVTIREMEGKRASKTVRRFVAEMMGDGDEPR